MTNNRTPGTEAKIIQAARKVFLQKGMAGARMMEIATEAGINKALLHYYFRSKEKLFMAIFKESIEEMGQRINLVFSKKMPLDETIRNFVDQYMDMLIEHPYLPGFVVYEINRNPELLIQTVLQSSKKPNPLPFIQQLNEAIANGTIKAINPVNFIINLVSLCVFPFIARPMLMGIMNLSDKDFEAIMNTRKKETADFILNAMKP